MTVPPPCAPSRCAVESPRSLAEALRVLRDAPPDTALLAGGTDLMVELATGRTRPERVIDLWAVDELRGIEQDQGGVRIGSLTTCAALVRSPLVRQRADILALAADEVGAEQIKSRATLGGNLGTASPAADLNPVLFVLDACVRLVSAAGQRELAAVDFVMGYRANARRSDELIESIWIPARPTVERRAFRKVGTRRAQSIAKVVVALAVSVEEGHVARVRGSAGSVGPSTVMLPALERELVGAEPDAERVLAASRAAAREDCTPVDDVRSSAAYRRVVLQRLLASMLGELCGGSGA